MTGQNLRLRLVGCAFLASGFIALLVSAGVVWACYGHLMSDVQSRLVRVTGQLQDEYLACGGYTPAFIAHMDEDVQEHDARRTFILLTDSNGAVRHATPMPGGFRARLQHQLLTSRFRGRVYTEREEQKPSSHGALRYLSRPLHDGCRITLALEVTNTERFLIFLTCVLGVMSLVSSLCSMAFAWLIGGRILGLNRLVDEKDRAYSELRRLTDDIGHDLRTPLTRLGMAAESAVSGGALREPLPQLVMEECSSMIELINTMLTISQTEAQVHRTPREPLELRALVLRSLEVYQPLAEDSRIRLMGDLPPDAIWFSGHKARLQQLLGNLLDNALKFTSSGGSIRVRLAASGGEITLCVEDDGCGIAPADVPRVFDRFWRGEAARHKPGNGLGLSLVKAIVTSYGGNIRCESALGKGTIFTIRLPQG